MKNSKKSKPVKSSEIDPKEKILDAAVTIFSQNGFEGARTRDIANLAQINISTLHYHFKSKDNIYASVIQEINSQCNKYMMPTMIAQKEIITNSKNKKEIIEAVKVMAITFIETIISPENKSYSKIIAFEQIEQSKHFKTLFENVMKRVCEPFLLAVGKITDKKTTAIEVILLTHALHGILTSFQHSKSSLLYLSGWSSYDDKNIKHIKKHILRTIDHLFEPYF
jgi:AcrR family transcriptional regulator